MMMLLVMGTMTLAASAAEWQMKQGPMMTPWSMLFPVEPP